MNSRTDIIQQIKKAMADSCDDMLQFTDEPSRKISAEYLFTVNAAKAISRLNGPPADPYKIYIEKGTKSFARDCLLPMKSEHPMRRSSSVFRRETPNVGRNGRIDIAVYYDRPNNGYLGEQPLCAIEVKGFNPQRKTVLADLKRNLAFHRVFGKTGRSVLCFSLFASLHSFEKSVDEKRAQLNIDKTLTKFQKWISELGVTNDVEIEIATFTVSKELVGRVIDEGEYSALDTDSRHHFVGSIICFKQKEI